jgi:hypothetical protein
VFAEHGPKSLCAARESDKTRNVAAVVPQPELRDQLGCSKLSKLGEIDGVYQLRGAVGGANPPLRLVLGGGGETPPAMWGERL